MRPILALTIVFLAATSLFAQTNTTGLNDTVALKKKLAEYTKMLRAADVYEGRCEAELPKIDQLKKTARIYLDSAAIEARRARSKNDDSEYFIAQFNKLYTTSLRYTEKADSLFKIARSYKDTATQMNKLAEDFYLKISDEFTSVMKYDSLYNAIYVVQIGAGKMNLSYFNKVENVEVVVPSDGIKRFIVGRFSNKEDALAYRKKMVAAGYPDSFVRTSESLNY